MSDFDLKNAKRNPLLHPKSSRFKEQPLELRNSAHEPVRFTKGGAVRRCLGWPAGRPKIRDQNSPPPLYSCPAEQQVQSGGSGHAPARSRAPLDPQTFWKRPAVCRGPNKPASQPAKCIQMQLNRTVDPVQPEQSTISKGPVRKA